MPNVPTLAEAGMEGFDAGIWIGLAGLRRERHLRLSEKLSGAANDALKADEVRTALKRQGTRSGGGTPKEFADFIRADIEKWAAVLASPGSAK